MKTVVLVYGRVQGLPGAMVARGDEWRVMGGFV